MDDGWLRPPLAIFNNSLRHIDTFAVDEATSGEKDTFSRSQKRERKKSAREKYKAHRLVAVV